MPIPKSKINRKGDIDEPASYDQCQTPVYAMDPLWEYLLARWRIWECACGKRNLVRGMERRGYQVIASDSDPLVQPPICENFFYWEPNEWDCIVTNPPFTIKFDWLKHCYELGKPFALLLRLEVWGAAIAQRMFKKHGIEVILLDKRPNYEMPNMGTSGGGSWFPVAWFTHGLNIGREVTYGDIIPRPDEQPFLLEVL
jgi:hypothetical protein